MKVEKQPLYLSPWERCWETVDKDDRVSCRKSRENGIVSSKNRLRKRKKSYSIKQSYEVRRNDLLTGHMFTSDSSTRVSYGTFSSLFEGVELLNTRGFLIKITFHLDACVFIQRSQSLYLLHGFFICRGWMLGHSGLSVILRCQWSTAETAVSVIHVHPQTMVISFHMDYSSESNW